MDSTQETALSSKWRFSVLGKSLFVAMLGVGALAAGCADNHVGRACDIGAQVDGGQTNAIVNPSALECPSRVCLLPNAEKTTSISMPTGPLCTADCSSDDDCANGERRSGGNTRGCQSGFKCLRLVGGLESSPIACQPVCVCKDFLSTDTIMGGVGEQPGCAGNNRI